MPISNRINRGELSGFLVQEELITTGDLVSDNLGAGGLLTVGDKGIDGFSPTIKVTPIESSEGKAGYILNITDRDNPEVGTDYEIWNGTGISGVELDNEYHLILAFDDGTQ